MFTTINSGKALLGLVFVIFNSFLFLMMGCGKSSVESLLLAERERRQKTEAELRQVKAELEKVKAELERGTPSDLQERIKYLEKLNEKVPQATINDVKFDEKKKSMDIIVEFDIKNRKGIEGSVRVYFYRHDGRALVDRNKEEIYISKKFTPERVEDRLTIKLSMSYAKLNVKQPHDLEFRLRIYDDLTDSFLEKSPYSKQFDFDPFKD